MQKVKYIIMGAGPAGLAFANRLLDLGEGSFVVLEQESVPGGLCRSEEVDGAPLDIGGGHFLDTVRPRVLEFIFRFLDAAQWLRFERRSTIYAHGTEIDYPFESNLWQLPIAQQVEYLTSIARAGCNTVEPIPASFSAWIAWKLGDEVARNYMLPYNRKIWSIDLDRLGTYWLHKLPSVSFRETLTSCLERRHSGTIPAHASFLYPSQGGYGRVWRRMGERLGQRLQLETKVAEVDALRKMVHDWQATEGIVTTVPWTAVGVWRGMPAALAQQARRELEHTSIVLDYFTASDKGKSHWIYVPDEATPHHRILNRYNFCGGAPGYWTETNRRRHVGARAGQWSYDNEYAYPLSTREKPMAIRAVLDWGAVHGIIGLGRWGEWEHLNSDVAVEHGMQLAERLAGEKFRD